MSIFSYWPVWNDGPALAPPLPAERGLLANGLALPTLQKHRTPYASQIIIPVPLRLTVRIRPGPAAAVRPIYTPIGSCPSAFTAVKTRDFVSKGKMATLNWISSEAASVQGRNLDIQNGQRESQLNTSTSEPKKKKKFDCPTCGKYFQYPRSLETHKLVHTDTRPHACPYHCGKSFRQSGHLQTHVLIHTGEKPFKCPVNGCKTPAFRHANRRCPYHPTDRLKKIVVPMREKAPVRSPGSTENHPDDVATAMVLVELSRKGYANSGY